MYLTRPYQKDNQVSSAKMHFFKLFFTSNLQEIINFFFAYFLIKVIKD